MSFNEQELLKIIRKTSGWFKSKSRIAIAEAIARYRPEIEKAKELPSQGRQKVLVALMNQATNERHIALQGGANSFSNPGWASAATVESWLHALLGGSVAEIERVEDIVRELESRA